AGMVSGRGSTRPSSARQLFNRGQVALELNFRERQLGKEDEPLLPIGDRRLAEGLQAGNDEARAKTLAVRFGTFNARTIDFPPARDERLYSIAALDVPRDFDMPPFV